MSDAMKLLPGIIALILVAMQPPLSYCLMLKSRLQPIIQTGYVSKEPYQVGIDDTDETVEEFQFWIKDYKVNHQSEINNLNIKVHYRYVIGLAAKDYPDFRLIAKDIEYLLATYPNKTDYWEVLNKRITSMILKNYKSLWRITCEIQVSPSALDPYFRSSVVTRTRSKTVSSRMKYPQSRR